MDQLANFGKRYQAVELIGIGGMAEVYLGKMLGAMGFEKRIVIKKLFSQLAKDPEIVAQFLAEARLAALLHHENIAYVYDFGEIDGTYFIAMEYLFGRDLHSVRQRAAELERPMGVEQALFIAAKICEGMEYAHSLKDQQQKPLNIIHRDLSPHNVFITFDGKVKIIDFGIARADLFDNRTKTGMVKGKISYMSPEQLAGAMLDQRSDIFSIGILLYEMLCGKRMYSGDTATLIRKCMEVEFDDLRIIQPDLNPEVYKILDQALAKDRVQRYTSCGKMRNDLLQCLFAISGHSAADNLKDYLHSLFAGEIDEEEKKIVAGLSEIPHEITPTADNLATVPAFNMTARQHKPTGGPVRRWALILIAGCAVLAVIVIIAVGVSHKEEKGSIGGTGSGREENVRPAAEPQTAPLVASLPQKEERRGNEDNGVEKLITQAEQAMEVSGGKDPQLGQALAAYRSVLEIQPDNIIAIQGIHRIGEYYGAYAEQAIASGDLSEASVYLRTGLSLSPKDPELLAIEARLVEKQEEIKSLVSKAEEALERNNLSTPVEDNAYNYYRQILQIDEKNSMAARGIARIADRYAELAEDSFRAMRIHSAREYVRQGLNIAPQHRHLLQLQRDLSRSRPGIFFKGIEKSIRPAIR